LSDGELPPISNIWTGEWHQRTLEKEKLRLGTNNVALLPIALFIDKTNLDKLGRTKACPIILSLLNYVQDVIAGDESKKIFGYYPDVHLSKEQQKKPQFKRMMKELYDYVTEKMLDGFVDLYNEGGIQWQDQSGETWNLVPVMAFVATDMEEAQWMKGVYQGRLAQMPCHLCEVSNALAVEVIPNDKLRYRCGVLAGQCCSR